MLPTAADAIFGLKQITERERQFLKRKIGAISKQDRCSLLMTDGDAVCFERKAKKEPQGPKDTGSYVMFPRLRVCVYISALQSYTRPQKTIFTEEEETHRKTDKRKGSENSSSSNSICRKIITTKAART